MGRLTVIFLSGLVVAAAVSGPLARCAKADQAFICENGRLLQVAQHDLQRLKRTNPCVARYFGLTVAKADVPPLPVRRVLPVRVAGAQITTGTTKDAGPSFRNVVVINARQGQPRIFHHRF